jgi:predicted PurR-regulated permease PerM
MDDRISQSAILWFFLALFLMSIFLMGWLLWPFISTIILAAVVTGLFSPVYNKLAIRVRPVFASLITCIIIFIIIFLPIVFCVGILSKEAYALYLMGKGAVFGDQIKTFLASSAIIEKSNQFLANFNIKLTGEEINNGLAQLGKTVGYSLYQQASSVASNSLNFIINFFLMQLIIFYLLIDGSRLITFIFDLSPLPVEQEEILIGKFKDMASAILVGNGLSGLIQGAVGGIIFALFGFESAFLWGVIMALLAFLPIIGVGVVFLPAAIYLLIKGSSLAGFALIIIYGVLSGGIEYLIKPKLVGKKVKMHTLLIFFSIIGGLKLFGILGIIYGPLVATAFLTLTDIYYASYRQTIDPASNAAR